MVAHTGGGGEEQEGWGGGEKERDARENEESKVALDRASVSPSASLVVRRSSFPSSFLGRAAYEALARGELHNSWPYYTPTAASPAYPLYRGPPPSPNPSCTTELSLRASTFSYLLFPGSALVACIVRHRCMRVLLTLCIRKNLCVRARVKCTRWIKLALTTRYMHAFLSLAPPLVLRAQNVGEIFRLSYERHPPLR